ncbi:uncharacterized protein LOC112182337 isoform X2 [Rosa chinensis]|uniref:uncharacterized protein LOC112182337 isoform X2 n=1 Tax=Rosa chinensis TaxID=74649 RepID=UPI001AD8E42D|nr:uncharacterized protein LOC112182337 isoform X2 [Rosa chinensis]
MYICLGALKNGFKAGCRAVIGLDGAHLKSAFGGQLLTAVGIDANNTTWVIAYAMVENETKDSWIWFLQLLGKDLDINDGGAGWTFISDKQKGLMPAFDDVVPLAHIRFCARHMWTNFTKLFPGKQMKDQMWKCAKATTIPFYLKEMEDMKQLNEKAYDWMKEPERPPKHWCRAFFNTAQQCDILINNLCESFNGWIRDARGKPPLSMFEEIRVKLMTRIQLRRAKMQAYHGNICPKARKTLEKNKLKAATDCISTFNGGHQAEVENFGGSKNTVDLNLRTCSCRRWDLSGIPCKHAVSAIFQKREDPDDYVAECYLKKTYMAIYSNLIMPVNGMDLWLRGEGPAMLPPQYTRQPGRPKTVRIKDSSEKAKGSGTKLGRVQKSLKCGNCGVLGHNMKTCHRHLPPKEKSSALNKRRKLNNGEGSETQIKKGKKTTLTKNELRKKAKETAEYQRKKMASMKASRAARTKSAPIGSRSVPPPPAPTRPPPTASSRPVQSSQASSTKAANPTRTSQRIRQNSGTGGGK